MRVTQGRAGFPWGGNHRPLALERWRFPLANASRNWRSRSLVLTALAALALSIPAVSAQAETRNEKCEKELKKHYGAASVSDMSTNNSSNNNNKNNRPVYATATLDNGEQIRVRCGYSGGGISGIQVFQQAPLGSANPGPLWGPADTYRTPPRPDPEPETKGAKAEPQAGTQPGTPAPDAGAKPGEAPKAGTTPEAPPADQGDTAQSEKAGEPEPSGPKRLKPPSSTGS